MKNIAMGIEKELMHAQMENLSYHFNPFSLMINPFMQKLDYCTIIFSNYTSTFAHKT